MKRNEPSISWLTSPQMYAFGLAPGYVKDNKAEIIPLENWHLKEGASSLDIPDNLMEWETVHLPWLAKGLSSAYPWYPWDGQENLRPGQVPKDNGGVWFGHEADLEEGRYEIEFGKIAGTLYLFINNRFAGFIKNPAGPARFDISEYIIPGINTIAALVFAGSSASWLTNFDLPMQAGLQGKVFLEKLPETGVRTLSLQPVLDETMENARIYLNIESEPEKLPKHIVVKDPNGVPVLEFDSSADSIAMDLTDLHLWNAETPDLYSVHIDIYENKYADKPVQSLEESFGLRKAQALDGQIFINETPVRLWGWKVPDGFFEGRDQKEIRAILEQLQRNHINTLDSRMPLAGDVYALADAMGFYILEDMDLHTAGEFDEPAGFERMWKQQIFSRLKMQDEISSPHPAFLYRKPVQQAFGRDVELELTLYLNERAESSASLPPGADIYISKYSSLKKARQILQEKWDLAVVFTGSICQKELRILEQEPNFAGFILEDNEVLSDNPDIRDLFAPIRLACQNNGLRIENHASFADTSNLQFQCSMTQDGKTIYSENFEEALPPRSFKRVFLSWPKPEADSSWKKSAAAVCKTSGNEAGYGQQAYIAKPKAKDYALDLVNGQGRTGFYTEDGRVVFDTEGPLRLEKGPIRHNLWIQRPELIFFDPDEIRPADIVWKGAGENIRLVRQRKMLDEKEQAGTIRYDYVLPTLPNARCSVSWSVASGLVGVDAAFQQSMELQDVPYFGLCLAFPRPESISIQARRRDEVLDMKAKYRFMENCQAVSLKYPEGVEISLHSIHEDLDAWILPESPQAFRTGESRLFKDTDTVYILLSPSDFALKRQGLENDPNKHAQLSFILQVSLENINPENSEDMKE